MLDAVRLELILNINSTRSFPSVLVDKERVIVAIFGVFWGVKPNVKSF